MDEELNFDILETELGSNEEEESDDNYNYNCDFHEWDYKKDFKECYICNYREEFLKDPYETHVHTWAAGLIRDKPFLKVCYQCGKTKYEFECKEVDDEPFFRHIGNTVPVPIPVEEFENLNLNLNDIVKGYTFPDMPDRKPREEPQIQTVNGSRIKDEKERLTPAQLYSKWSLENPHKLSFVRKSTN